MSNNTIKVRTFNPGAGAYGEDGPAYQGNLRKGELRGIIHINKEHCVGCDTCSKFCPVNAIEGGLGAKHHIIEDACLYCGQCLIACPFDAIEQMSFVDQVEKVLADKSRLCADRKKRGRGRRKGRTARLHLGTSLPESEGAPRMDSRRQHYRAGTGAEKVQKFKPSH